MKSFYSLHREKQTGLLPGGGNSKQFLCCLSSHRDSAWRRWLQVLLEAVTVWMLLSIANKGAHGEAAKGPQASKLLRSQEWTKWMKSHCIPRHSPSDCVLILGSSTHCASALYGLLSRERYELIKLCLCPEGFPLLTTLRCLECFSSSHLSK